MNPFFKRIILSVLFTTGGIGLWSCCWEMYRLTGAGELNAFVQTAPSEEVDTVRGPFTLSTYFDYEAVAGTINYFSLANTAYARKCELELDSFLDSNSSALTVNRPLVFNGDTVAAGSDLEETSFVLTTKEYGYGGNCNYQFNEGAMQGLRFDDQPYTFTFTGLATGGQRLQFSKVLYFRL